PERTGDFPMRTQLIEGALQMLHERGQTISLEKAQAVLDDVPSFGELLQDEFDAALQALGAVSVTEDNVTEKLSHEEAVEAIVQWENGLQEARQARMKAVEAETQARHKLAVVISHWQHGKPLTRDELIKDYLKKSVEERRARHDAGLPATAMQQRR